MRTVLDYDKWIPSILFLAHYYPYSPRWSQLQNIASLMLGHNGIWGNLDLLDASGVELFANHMNLYKQVRRQITECTLVRTGMPGDSHEVYEKIDPDTGRGVVVIFANHKGRYAYVTRSRVANRMSLTSEVNVRLDEQGMAVIDAYAEMKTAMILYFGLE
jgi:alpha-galactosidase